MPNCQSLFCVMIEVSYRLSKNTIKISLELLHTFVNQHVDFGILNLKYRKIMANSTEDTIFKNLNADDIDHTVTEIESCCMNCYKNVRSYFL